MLDLHSHILPGIDDGAKTIEDSLEMAHIAMQSGTTAIGSDAHSPRTRSPRLTDTKETIASLVGPAQVQQLLYLNPLQIIESEEVDIPEVQVIAKAKKPGLLSRIWQMIG